jgi:predicted adenylyl cyclase CyaB
MKQIEITVRVNNQLNEIDSILTRQGFRIIRRSRIEDNYKTLEYNNLSKDNILNVLSKCVLIRYLNVNNEKEFKKITYKNKIYENNNVISEEKISVNIDDINNADKLFEILGFKTIVNVNYDAIVYSNDKIELCFQDVEGLGLLLEYENEKDFDGYSSDEIIKEKYKMLDEIKKYNLNITNEIDVKKAYELIYTKIS